MISIGKWILWDFVIYYLFSMGCLQRGEYDLMTFGVTAGSLGLRTTQERNLENEVYMHNKIHMDFL